MDPLILSVWIIIFLSPHHPHAAVATGRGMQLSQVGALRDGSGRGMPLAAGDHHQQQIRHVRALRDYYSHASASGRGMPLPAGTGRARRGPGHHHPAVVVAGRGMPLQAGDHQQQLRHVRALRDYYSDALGPGGYQKEGNYDEHEANQINTTAADHSTGAGQANNGQGRLIWATVSAIAAVCVLLSPLPYWILKFYKLKTTPQLPPPASAAAFKITNHYTFSDHASMVNNNPAPPLVPSPPPAPPLVPSPPAPPPAPTIDLDLDIA